MSKIDRSNVRAVCPEIRSSGPSSNCVTAQSVNARALAWEMGTPLGEPVVPDVNRIYARSSGPTSLLGGSAAAASMSASVKSVRGGAGSGPIHPVTMPRVSRSVTMAGSQPPASRTFGSH